MESHQDSPAKRQRMQESSIVHLVLNSMITSFFVESLSHQLFARLSRCCRNFRDTLAILKPQKVDQLLALYARRTGDLAQMVGVSRAYRMFRDNQITETQYRILYNTFYLKDNQPLLNLDSRTKDGYFITQLSHVATSWYPPVSCFRWSENFPTDKHFQSLKQIRYPYPLDLMPFGTSSFALELACQGYDLFILGRAIERRASPAYMKTHVGKWNSVEDVDFWTVKQLCERVPRLYDEFPDHILELLVNEHGNATWLQLPRLISVKTFVALRTQPYELADVLRLGFSPKEFSTVKVGFNLLPPVSVLAWLHADNPKFLFDIEANYLRLAFVPIARTLAAQASFRYVLTSGLAKGLLAKMKAEATTLAIGNVIRSFTDVSDESERLQFLY
jgi:hypothetical protein